MKIHFHQVSCEAVINSVSPWPGHIPGVLCYVAKVHQDTLIFTPLENNSECTQTASRVWKTWQDGKNFYPRKKTTQFLFRKLNQNYLSSSVSNIKNKISLQFSKHVVSFMSVMRFGVWYEEWGEGVGVWHCESFIFQSSLFNVIPQSLQGRKTIWYLYHLIY